VPNVPKPQKSFWMHQMILLGDDAQVEAQFSPFEDSGNLDIRWEHGMCRMYPSLIKSFWTHLIELLGDVGRVESRFGPFGDSIGVGSR
jgi:hypothetical protein